VGAILWQVGIPPTPLNNKFQRLGVTETALTAGQATVEENDNPDTIWTLFLAGAEGDVNPREELSAPETLLYGLHANPRSIYGLPKPKPRVSDIQQVFHDGIHEPRPAAPTPLRANGPQPALHHTLRTSKAYLDPGLYTFDMEPRPDINVREIPPLKASIR
jgi:hypothetical protein